MSELEFNAVCNCGKELEHFEAEPELGHLSEIWCCQDCDRSFIAQELYCY